MYSSALEYYFEQCKEKGEKYVLIIKIIKLFPILVKVVLESFECTFDDLNLPKTLPEFTSLVRKCLVLEFIIVTVVKPILSVPKPKKLLTWHKETERNKRRRYCCIFSVNSIILFREFDLTKFSFIDSRKMWQNLNLTRSLIRPDLRASAICTLPLPLHWERFR